jgi:hypothetical protein
MGAVRSELLELAEIDEPTDEQSARFTELETEFDSLEAERAPLAARAEKIEAVRAARLEPKNVEPAPSPPSPTTVRARVSDDAGPVAVRMPSRRSPVPRSTP